MTAAVQFSYSKMPGYPDLEPGLPVLPLQLIYAAPDGTAVTVPLRAIVDSGSSVNILPYDVGIRLGLCWEAQSFELPVAQWLRGTRAFGVLLGTHIEPFPPVELAFAWVEKTSAEVPILLGETNFFQEFDVCLSGSQELFSIAPKGALIREADKQIIGDNFESGGGAMNIAKDHGTATQTNYTVTSSGSSDELLQLLDKIRQELTALPVDEELKGDVLYELEGAERQAKKAEPDKEKIVDKLKAATNVLEEGAKSITGAVAIGNMLGQAITWCSKLGVLG